MEDGKRASFTKYFAVPQEFMETKTTELKYNSYKEYKEAKDLKAMCIMYSMAYADTMLTRLEQEQPDYFAEDSGNKSKPELSVHLANNMCLDITKYHSRVFRDTHAKVTEKHHLDDQIRRLSNGGDKFHPYL
jgi:hypothetical protein